MPLWARRNLSVDDVISAIKKNADEIRTEARRVSDSHEKMDQIADRMEALMDRLQERDPNA